MNREEFGDAFDKAALELGVAWGRALLRPVLEELYEDASDDCRARLAALVGRG